MVNIHKKIYHFSTFPFDTDWSFKKYILRHKYIMRALLKALCKI